MEWLLYTAYMQCLVSVVPCDDQMALQFDVNPVINEFVSSIPQHMTEAPWYYNNTLISRQQVNLAHAISQFSKTVIDY